MMNWQKINLYTILILLIIPVTFSIVSAREWSEVKGFGTMGSALGYLFGPITELGNDATSAAIITIAIWLLIIVTFGDIITSFSSFSKPISWIVAVLIGIIAANLGWGVAVFAWLTGAFAIFGITTVYVALGAAFVAFALVNLGVWNARKWVLRRRAMMAANQAAAGGTKIAGAIKGIGQIGKELGKIP